MKKIGLIGVGKMGLSHLAIARSLDGVEVAAICDPSTSIISALEKNIGIKGYANYKKMLMSEDLDGIIISVPNFLHYEVTRDCLDSGINVFVEKPLTGKADLSRKLIDKATKSELFGQVGYMNRFNLVFRHLQKLLDADVIGDVIAYESRALGAVVVKSNTKGWRNDYEKGGGCLFDYGAHAIDLALYLFGEDASVQSAVLKRIFSSNVDDAVFATLLHQDGKVGTVRVNWSDKSIRKMVNQIEVFGTAGKIFANKQEIKIYLDEAREDLNLPVGWSSVYVTDLDTKVQHYLRGEEYSLQLEAFAARLYDPKAAAYSSLDAAGETDRVLTEIFEMSGGTN